MPSFAFSPAATGLLPFYGFSLARLVSPRLSLARARGSFGLVGGVGSFYGATTSDS